LKIANVGKKVVKGLALFLRNYGEGEKLLLTTFGMECDSLLDYIVAYSFGASVIKKS
jgi:hypothetical protein